jgi:uncharacterized membrane protein YbaN (DUF454 family)
MAARQAIVAEWKRFSADRPGERFERRFERLRGGGPHRTALRITAGLVLLAIGVLLLFIPGPGTPVIVGAVGMFAGDSLRLSRLLDRGEPPARRLFTRLVERWRRIGRGARAAIYAAGGVATLGLSYGAWALWTG